MLLAFLSLNKVYQLLNLLNYLFIDCTYRVHVLHAQSRLSCNAIFFLLYYLSFSLFVKQNYRHLNLYV